MSVYSKYKSSRLWDVDFRTGSFKDRSSNVNFSINGAMNNSGMPLGTTNYINTSGLSINEPEMTIIFNCDIGNDTGQAQRFMDGDINIYLTGGTNLQVIIGTIIEVATGLDALNNTGTTLALTFKNGVLKYYINGVFAQEDSYTPTNISVSSFIIHTATGIRILNGAYKYNIAYNKALTASEVAQLTSELSAVPDTRVRSKSIVWDTATSTYIPDIVFKGEMHALANERTISSGFLENTGWQIQAGSAKVVTENKDSVSCRVLENVSAGTIYRSSNFGGDKWSFWIKKGANGNDMRLGFMSDGVATNPFDASIDCFYVHINDTTNIGLTQNNNGSIAALDTGDAITDTNWHLLEITKVGTAINVYVDGVLNCSGTATISFGSKFMLFDWDAGDKIIWSSDNHQLDFYQKT